MLLTSLAMADAPLEPLSATQNRKLCSFNGQFCVRYDAAANLTTIFANKPHPKFKTWTVPGRLDAALIANTGEAVAKIPATANLLPKRAAADTTVLCFYAPGKVVARIQLKQVIAHPAQLPETESHVQWASSYGFEANGDFLLITAEGNSFRIDPKTGKASNRRYF